MRQEKSEVLPWLETVEQRTCRARKGLAYMNQQYDVAGLCREFPDRLQSVKDGEGGRLPK